MNRSLRIYIYAISSLFWLGLFAALMTGALGNVHLQQLAPLFGLAIAVEAIGVRKQDNTIGFSAVAHLAAAVLFGPVAAASIAAVAVVLVDGSRSRRTHFILLNSAMFGTAAWTAGLAYEATGGTVGTVVPSKVLPLVALVATRLLVNEAIFSGAVSMMHASFRRALRDNLRDSFGQSIGEGCLGVLLAYGYNRERWAMLPFLVPLLAALYQAQASYERLKSETKDALDALAAVVDERDPLTTQHSERVAALVDRFTGAIGLPDRESRRLVDAARFHDLGKIAIDVATLSKEGRLTDQEMRAIRSHPRLSARLLSPFGFAEQISLYAELHHERYDGRGYYAVSQSEIPVEAHVLIAADSYDAMTSKRAYRAALTPQEAVAELRDKAGSQFHPLVARAFAAMIEGRDPNEVMGRSQVTALRDGVLEDDDGALAGPVGSGQPRCRHGHAGGADAGGVRRAGAAVVAGTDTCIGGGAGIGLGVDRRRLGAAPDRRRAYRDRRWGLAGGGAGGGRPALLGRVAAVPAAAVRVPGAARRRNRRRGAARAVHAGAATGRPWVQRPAGVRYLDRDHRRR